MRDSNHMSSVKILVLLYQLSYEAPIESDKPLLFD